MAIRFSVKQAARVLSKLALKEDMGIVVKTWMRFWLILSILLGLAACGPNQLGSNIAPLPEIAKLVAPQLPEWIEQISPTKEAETLAQIRIRFKEPLIPVESLEEPARKDKLNKFEIQPDIPGQFRFLTPRMVGFQADKALPKATRIQVKIKAGLEDLSKHRLDRDIAWTFTTEPIKLTNLPKIKEYEYAEPQSISVKPTLKFTSNVELDLDSLKERIQLIPKSEKTPGIALKVELEKSDIKDPQEEFDPSVRDWKYTIIPQQELKKNTAYRLEFAPGLRAVSGNLASDKPFDSEVQTYAPLKFEGLQFSGSGKFVKGSAQLKFNNGLVAENAIANISINPPPKSESELVQIYENSNAIALNSWALEPATTYTITIGANLKDKFGQTLDKPIAVKYETGDATPDIAAPSGLAIFPINTNKTLNISAINLPDSQYKAAYQVVQPTDLVYTDSPYPRSLGNNLLPDSTKWSIFKVNGKKNKPTNIAVSLREKFGTETGMLAYGIQARTNRYQENGKEKWVEPTIYGMVQVTNLGVFAQWFPDSGLIRVNHLSDGSAVGSAPVEIYQSQLGGEKPNPPIPFSTREGGANSSSPQRGGVLPCAQGKTDKTGILVLKSQDLQQCMNGDRFSAPPELLIIARENKDWTFARTAWQSGYYGYGIYADWDGRELRSRGTIFSDRQLYQPGEKAWFTGVSYYLQNGAIALNKNTPYTVILRDSNGKPTDLGKYTTNEFGTFSLELHLKSNQPLGSYSIVAKGENGLEISGEFRVAEFKPPNFQVELNLDKEVATINEKIEAKAQGNYLFGSPLAQGKVKYYVKRSPTTFTPKGWEKFSFGQQWFWPQERPSVKNDVLQKNAKFDNNGKDSLTVTIDKDLPYPMTYQIDAEVSDVSNLAVADSKTLTALPSDRLIGLQSNFVADAGKEFPVQIIVTDASGKAIAGERVRLELQEIKYSSITPENPQYKLEYKTVLQKEITSGSNPQTISPIPPKAGSYRIRANFVNAKNEIAATDMQIWASGDNTVQWGRNDYLEIKLDKPTYQLGETATALILSPYPEAELQFAVIRDKILYQTVTKVKGGAPQIQFKVTPEMQPNAAVQAVLVRQGASLNKLKEVPEKLVQIGFAPFKTSLKDKYLKVKISPEKTQVEPAGEQTVQLEAKDAQNKPIKAQFTMMVVDEAVLQLTGYRPPDLVETVYGEQSISTRFEDNRFHLLLKSKRDRSDNDLERETTLFESSGNIARSTGRTARMQVAQADGNLAAPAIPASPPAPGSAGAANIRIRKDFQPFAYYNGSVITDENGRATVTFKLPDNLTTWQVIAIATNTNMQFGNGEAKFTTTQPLVSNPLLPQFARQGDRFSVGLSVTNNAETQGNLTINGEINGALKFEGNNPTAANLQTPAESGTRAYRFPIVAASIGESKLRFTTKLNDKGDAFEVPLLVKPLEITEQVVETGTTTNLVKIPLNVNNNVVNDAGGLEIAIASTLIPELAAPARQVLEDDALPFLEPAASQLAIAASLQTLSQKYSQTFADFNPTQQAAQSIERLQKLQQPDGGFASLPGQQNSDPFIAPYAAQSLALAKAAGLKVDAGMLSRVSTYLKQILANPEKYEFCKESLCKTQVRLSALIALAELGETRNDFVDEIYKQRQQLDIVAQIKLANYLSQLPEWQTESQTLFNQLQETIYETGRSAVVNLPQSWGWMNSSTIAQSQALRLSISQKSKPEVRDRLLQGLLALRRNGTWQNSYDNAEALAALVEYSKTQPTPPNFIATASLGEARLDSTQFKGYENPNLSINVGMNKLPRSRHDLILQKSGTGTLHYLVAYRYRLQGNQSGRFNGLRVTREIRPANQEQILEKTGLSVSDKPLKLEVGQVFDIGLEIIADRPVDNVAIYESLPAGLEAIDASFQTSTPAVQAQVDSWQIGYQTIYRDRVVAYSDRLDPGVYNLHYLARSVTPGTFIWPGVNVHLQYAPEEFGRTADSTLIVSDR